VCHVITTRASQLLGDKAPIVRQRAAEAISLLHTY
jgi:hypothetical protein